MAIGFDDSSRSAHRPPRPPRPPRNFNPDTVPETGPDRTDVAAPAPKPLSLQSLTRPCAER